MNNFSTQPVGTSFIICNVALTWKLLSVQYFDCVCMLVTIKSCGPTFLYKLSIPEFSNIRVDSIRYFIFNFIVVGMFVKISDWHQAV